MIWVSAAVIAACVIVAVAAGITLAQAWRRVTSGSWPDDPPCPTCKHERVDHQLETLDGACAHFPCGCRMYGEPT